MNWKFSLGGWASMRSSNSRFPLPSPFKRINLVLISGFDAALAEKPVATTGYFLLGNQRRLTHRHHIIQHLIHRQLAQHDDLGDAEKSFALAAVEQGGEVAKHDAGRAKRFAGVNQ